MLINQSRNVNQITIASGLPTSECHDKQSLNDQLLAKKSNSRKKSGKDIVIKDAYPTDINTPHRVRTNAIQFGGEAKYINGKAVSSLIKILKTHKQSRYRAMAARELGKMKTKAAVNVLIQALLKDRSSRVGRASAWALGEIGDPKALIPLRIACKQRPSIKGEAIAARSKIANRNFWGFDKKIGKNKLINGPQIKLPRKTKDKTNARQ